MATRTLIETATKHERTQVSAEEDAPWVERMQELSYLGDLMGYAVELAGWSVGLLGAMRTGDAQPIFTAMDRSWCPPPEAVLDSELITSRASSYFAVRGSLKRPVHSLELLTYAEYLTSLGLALQRATRGGVVACPVEETLREWRHKGIEPLIEEENLLALVRDAS